MLISCDVLLEARLQYEFVELSILKICSSVRCTHMPGGFFSGHPYEHKVKKPLDWRRVLPIVWRIHCLALYTSVWYALIFYAAELEPYAKPLPERHWKLILERGWQTCWLIQNKLTIFWKHRCHDFIYLRVYLHFIDEESNPTAEFTSSQPSQLWRLWGSLRVCCLQFLQREEMNLQS